MWSDITEVLKLAHDALGHEDEWLVLKDLRKKVFQVHRLFYAVVKEVAVSQHFEWRTELIHYSEKVHVLVILLAAFDAHIY
jgi:hypothetical protein